MPTPSRVTTAVAAALLAGGVAALVAFHRPPFRTAAAVERAIAAEAPVGSDEARVAAFLRAHGIEHSPSGGDPGAESDFRRNPKLAGKRARITRQSVAIIRGVGRDVLTFTEYSLVLHFYFDAAGALVEYTVQEVGTGM